MERAAARLSSTLRREEHGEIQDHHAGGRDRCDARAAATTSRWKRSKGVDAEIVEGPVGNEDAFIAVAKDADAIYAKGMPHHQEDHRQPRALPR